MTNFCFCTIINVQPQIFVKALHKNLSPTIHIDSDTFTYTYIDTPKFMQISKYANCSTLHSNSLKRRGRKITAKIRIVQCHLTVQRRYCLPGQTTDRVSHGLPPSELSRSILIKFMQRKISHESFKVSRLLLMRTTWS